MSAKAPMVRLNSHVEKHVLDALQAIATEEGIAYAEVVRQVLQAGLLARQDQRTHHTRMFTLIESLEVKVKDIERRISSLEVKLTSVSA